LLWVIERAALAVVERVRVFNAELHSRAPKDPQMHRCSSDCMQYLKLQCRIISDQRPLLPTPKNAGSATKNGPIALRLQRPIVQLARGGK
jgi:hypothetical protein